MKKADLPYGQRGEWAADRVGTWFVSADAAFAGATDPVGCAWLAQLLEPRSNWWTRINAGHHYDALPRQGSRNVGPSPLGHVQPPDRPPFVVQLHSAETHRHGSSFDCRRGLPKPDHGAPVTTITAPDPVLRTTCSRRTLPAPSWSHIRPHSCSCEPAAIEAGRRR